MCRRGETLRRPSREVLSKKQIHRVSYIKLELHARMVKSTLQLPSHLSHPIKI